MALDEEKMHRDGIVRIAEVLGMQGSSVDEIVATVAAIAEDRDRFADVRRSRVALDFYHVTRRSNIEGILTSGLEARLGPRAVEAGFAKSGVHCFDSFIDAERMLTGWETADPSNADPLVIVFVRTSLQPLFNTVAGPVLPPLSTSEISDIYDSAKGSLCDGMEGGRPILAEAEDGTTSGARAAFYLQYRDLLVSTSSAKIVYYAYDEYGAIDVVDGRVKVRDIDDAIARESERLALDSHDD